MFTDQILPRDGITSILGDSVDGVYRTPVYDTSLPKEYGGRHTTPNDGGIPYIEIAQNISIQERHLNIAHELSHESLRYATLEVQSELL